MPTEHMDFMPDTLAKRPNEPRGRFQAEQLTFAPSPSTYSLPAVDSEMLATMPTLGEDGEEHEAEIDPKKPLIALVWKDLAVSVRTTGKVLLNYVSGHVTEGLYAVMGPSGSGKTTLLNTLACRLDKAVKVSGYMHINGKNFTRNDLKKVAAYVPQDDLLNAYMSVHETLMFTARLRLSKNLTHEQREERIAAVSEAMGIAHIQNVLIGNAFIKGVSGGERKRTCVAMELLTKPSLLFLDEPTSGLDSVMSLQLMTKLRVLTDTKTCTVVTTIHQPQAKIFQQFTHLTLLTAGSILYQGLAPACIDFYASIGYPVPANENPVDHFMDAMAQPGVTDLMAKAYVPPEIDLSENSDQPVVAVPREPLPWIMQFAVLINRALKEQWRRRAQVVVQLLQAFVIGILLATAFRTLKPTNSWQRNRTSSLWSCIVNQGLFGALLAINSFPSERALALRERASGMYSSSAYFLAKSLSEMPVQTMVPVIFSCSVYFIIGYQLTAAKFFMFTAFMILTNMAACSLGLAVSAICRRIELGMVVLPMAFEIVRLYGSYFLPPSLTPHWLKWIDVLSFAKYGHIGIVINEFSGMKMTDYNPARASTSTSIPPNWQYGEQFLESQGYAAGNYIDRGKCAGILFVYIIIYRFVAYLGVRYLKH